MTLTTMSPAETAELLDLAVHEFRSPVTVVGGYLRLLTSGQLGALTDRQKSLVTDAEKSCAQLAALIQELGHLASLEAGTATFSEADVSLTGLVDEACARMEEGRDRGVVVTRDAADDPLVVRSDRARLLDGVQSLIYAVLREQGAPCTVRVITTRHTRSGHTMAALGIGVGDSARNVLELDRPGLRLNESRGGMGMKLPIARRVVDRFGGMVWSSATDRLLGAVALLMPLKETHS